MAFLVRAAAVLVPLLAGLVLARLAAPGLAHPRGRLGDLFFLVQVAVVSTAAATCTDRVTRRLLPLAALFRMSLVFPDEAPSRFGTALRAGSSKRLEADLRRVREHGLDDVPHGDAAALLLEMVSSLGKHDRLTRGHTERVRAYSEMIAEELDLPREDRDLLRWGVLVHDIGKLAVPAEILNKDGRPTDEEWAVLKSHPEVGGRLVEPLAPWLGDWRLAASEHHERFDGKGYPRGLAGAEISLAGRIVAVADAYDVITSARSYKTAMTPEQARQELVRCAGSQFDPEIVRAMLNISLGKLRVAGGPLGVLAELPLLGNVPATASAVPGGLTAISALAATVLAVSAPVAEAHPNDPVDAARVVIEQEVAGDLPAAAAPGERIVVSAPVTTTSLATTTTTIPTAAASASGPVPPPVVPSTPPVAGAPFAAPTTSVPSVAPPSTTPSSPAPPSTAPPITAPPSTAAPSGLLLRPDTATVEDNKQITIDVLGNDSPSAGGTFIARTLTIVVAPTHARDYQVGNGRIEFRAENHFGGTDSLTYRVCDTNGACATSTVTITIVDD